MKLVAIEMLKEERRDFCCERFLVWGVYPIALVVGLLWSFS